MLKKLSVALWLAVACLALNACLAEPQQQAPPQPVTVVNNLPVQGTSFSEMILGIIVIAGVLSAFVALVMHFANKLARTSAQATAATIAELRHAELNRAQAPLELPAVEANSSRSASRAAIERNAR